MATSAKQLHIIAGLGNPGIKYQHTRHNAGFDVIDMLAEKYNIKIAEKKFQALCGSGMIQGQKVLLMKPMTFMNKSGESIAEAARFYKIDTETELVVIYDDISLAPGRIRVRKKGSAGGHNGIKDIIAHTGTQVFPRVKVGVGEKPQGWDLADHVLGRMSKEDRQQAEAAFEDAVSAVEMILLGQIDQSMNNYNSKK
ncbi:MAG: aminoacyl-tRNA hydrolase [Lachnospiraceae bacterium]|nr:aminoacyl-tRNA hydrolase [Lachnospiraceae bacterium]